MGSNLRAHSAPTGLEAVQEGTRTLGKSLTPTRFSSATQEETDFVGAVNHATQVIDTFKPRLCLAKSTPHLAATQADPARGSWGIISLLAACGKPHLIQSLLVKYENANVSKIGPLAHALGTLPLYRYYPYRLVIEVSLIGANGQIGELVF